MGAYIRDPHRMLRIQYRDDLQVVLFALGKVKAGSIEQYDARIGQQPEVVDVGLLDALQVLRLDLLLVVAATLADIGHEFVYRGVEIEDQVRLRQIGVDDVKEHPVQARLGIMQVIHGKDERLLKEEIRHRKRFEDIRLAVQRLELLKPLCHKVQLYRECMPLRIGIKERQEGIVLKLLQYGPPVVIGGQLLHEGGLARPDAPLYGDKPVLHCR